MPSNTKISSVNNLSRAARIEPLERRVADYIAGMTDRYAERAHRQFKAGKAPTE